MLCSSLDKIQKYLKENVIITYSRISVPYYILENKFIEYLHTYNKLSS